MRSPPRRGQDRHPDHGRAGPGGDPPVRPRQGGRRLGADPLRGAPSRGTQVRGEAPEKELEQKESRTPKIS